MVSLIILATRSTEMNSLCQAAFNHLVKVERAEDLVCLHDKLKKHRNGIVILDLALPDIGNSLGIRNITTAFPDTKILAVSDTGNNKNIAAMFSAGVKGFCHNNIHPKLLSKAIERIGDGEVWLERRLTGPILAEIAKQAWTEGQDEREEYHPPLHRLTPREREIATLVSEGLCQKSITRRLVISENTVRNHLRNIFRKTGVTSRLQLALMVRAGAPP